MGRLWDYCAFCGKRIETGEMCYGLPNGESVCTDCCVAENEGVAVDVAPVPHGKWNIMSGTKSRRVCSRCGWDVPEYGKFYSYCPNCGAKMDGGDGDAVD